MQQGTGGDGLDGFAQTHFIREQGAFRKGEMQHAFALVREQGYSICRKETLADAARFHRPGTGLAAGGCDVLDSGHEQHR